MTCGPYYTACLDHMPPPQTKDLELSNPAKRAITYGVRLEGHKDFASDTTVVRIEPHGTARLRVCTQGRPRCGPYNQIWRGSSHTEQRACGCVLRVCLCVWPKIPETNV